MTFVQGFCPEGLLLITANHPLATLDTSNAIPLVRLRQIPVEHVVCPSEAKRLLWYGLKKVMRLVELALSRKGGPLNRLR